MKSRRLNFNDYAKAFRSKTTPQLFRSLITLRLCSWKYLVKNSHTIHKTLTKSVFLRPFVYFTIRHTFFKHFCAGENGMDIRPTVQRLEKHGVGSILDFAAEEDAEINTTTRSARIFPTDIGEAECDAHCETFLECVRAAAQFDHGFAALKVTALGRPELLERMTIILKQIRDLFSKFDRDGSRRISIQEFDESLNELGVVLDSKKRRDLFDEFDANNVGYIDIYEWSEYLKLEDLRTRPFFTEAQQGGKRVLKSLNDDELQQSLRMMNRLRRIATLAAETGVRLMIDAEQTYFQPAISQTVIQLQREFNRGKHPIIYNTYQCYLKDTPILLREDMKRCRNEGFKWGGKLVRGAYIVSERERALKMKYESPCWSSIEETHKCYNECMKYVLENNDVAEVMIASHNQETATLAVEYMNQYNINPLDGGVTFGQLLGMADQLTMILGAEGYRAYKYVPYGPIDKVMPYLLRRAQENSALLGSQAAIHERQLLRKELKRRLLW